MVKIRHKFKAKAAKNRHNDSVKGEKDSKFPLIIDQGRNKISSTKLDFYSENSENVQHEGVKDNNKWSSTSRKNLPFHEKLQLMKLGKFQWIKTRRVRTQSPHLHNQ